MHVRMDAHAYVGVCVRRFACIVRHRKSTPTTFDMRVCVNICMHVYIYIYICMCVLCVCVGVYVCVC